MRVQLMITCLADVLRPTAAQATVRLLRRLGHEVTVPERQTCCGQPLFNSGYTAEARAQARHTLEAFAGEEPIVVPSGSCAAMVKVEYPHLFEREPEEQARFQALAQRTWELSDFLVNRLGLLDLGARFTGRVAYHYACHGRLLGLVDETPQLIRHVRGAEYVELPRQDQCCGFGGSFAIRYPHISQAMVNDKVNCILGVEADLLISGDAGCLMNIGGRLRRRESQLPVMHLAELLEQR